MPSTSVPSSPKHTLCLCNTHAAWGGGEKWHLEAAKALVSRGWHIILLANPTCRLYEEGTRFAKDASESKAKGSLRLVPLKIKSLSFFNPCLMRRLIRFFREEKVQTLLLGLPAELKSVALAAKMAGVPRILYRRGSALPVRNSWSNRFLYGSILDALIVNSRQTRDLVLANNENLIAHERIHLLANGLPMEAFDDILKDGLKDDVVPAKAQKDVALAKEGVSRPLVLGNAGRLDKQKGQHYLIRMMPHLVAQGFDVELRIAGHGDLRDELEALAHTLGVAERVHFLGFMADMGSFWRELDIFVLSSLWEGFGYVVIESMAAKVPVVAFGVSNIPELIEHGKTGLLVPGPPEALPCQATSASHGPNISEEKASIVSPELLPEERLAHAVMALANNPSLRQDMGEAGRAHVMQHYTQDVCMDRLEQILLD